MAKDDREKTDELLKPTVNCYKMLS